MNTTETINVMADCLREAREQRDRAEGERRRLKRELEGCEQRARMASVHEEHADGAADTAEQGMQEALARAEKAEAELVRLAEGSSVREKVMGRLQWAHDREAAVHTLKLGPVGVARLVKRRNPQAPLQCWDVEYLLPEAPKAVQRRVLGSAKASAQAMVVEWLRLTGLLAPWSATITEAEVLRTRNQALEAEVKSLSKMCRTVDDNGEAAGPTPAEAWEQTARALDGRISRAVEALQDVDLEDSTACGWAMHQARSLLTCDEATS